VTPRLAAYGGVRFAYASDRFRSTAAIAPLAGLRVALRTTDVVAAEPAGLSDPNRAQGKDVRVSLNDGTIHRGKLVAFSASEVALDSRTVPLADVRKVEKRSHAVRNATLISLLAAVPTALTLGPAFDLGTPDVLTITATGIAGGITAGVVIGGVRKPGNVIYRAPGASASISVRPILARDRKGVAVTASW
jgi:small nuclear ribonucleoprotein (snRNP)-like protein